MIPFRRRYPPAVVDIRVRCSSRDIVATGAPDLLHIALYNLMLNAVEATHDANRRKPRIELHAQTMGDGVLIDVIDNGPGVPQALEHSLFEPFVSGRRGGSGLGLAIVRDIVDWHGGSVRQEAAGARLGARFRLLLKGRNTNPHSEEREGI